MEEGNLEKIMRGGVVLICLLLVGYLSNLNTATFIFIYLTHTALMISSVVGIYNLFKGIKSKWLLMQVIGVVSFGGLLYLQYGLYTILKSILTAVVLSTVILVYVVVRSR